MLSVTISGTRELEARLSGLPANMDRAIAGATRQATEMVYEQAKSNIARMFRTSGRMQSMLKTTFETFTGGARGTVAISGIGYVTQELGGRGFYDIFPVNRLALAFVAPTKIGFPGGTRMLTPGMVFAKHVRHPPLPERSFLRSALAQERSGIVELFAAVAARAAGET